MGETKDICRIYGVTGMKHEYGALCQYNGKLVFVCSDVINNIVSIRHYFNPASVAFVDTDDLKPVDPEVLKFMSLLGHVHQMTHDELKAQLKMLFGEQK
jgi:hypothetical protein